MENTTNTNTVMVARAIALVSLLGGQLMLYLIGANVIVQALYALLFLSVFFSRENLGYVFLLRVATPMSIGISFTLLYHYAYGIEPLKALLTASFQVTFMMDKFFDVISVLYAIVVAFLLWKGLTDYDLLRLELNREASIIRKLAYYTRYFDDPADRNPATIVRLMRDYITNIMDGDRVVGCKGNNAIIKRCIDAAAHIEARDLNDQIALEAIMQGIGDLSEIRSRRQAFMECKMSPYMMLFLVIMTIFLLYPLYTKTPQEGGIAAYIMIFSMSTLLAFMFVTMLDLRDPFAGYWKIKLDSFGELMRELEEMIAAEGKTVRKMAAA